MVLPEGLHLGFKCIAQKLLEQNLKLTNQWENKKNMCQNLIVLAIEIL